MHLNPVFSCAKSHIHLYCCIFILYVATVKFEQAIYNVSENERRVSATVVLLSDHLHEDSFFIVGVSTSDGSAIGDYNITILL